MGGKTIRVAAIAGAALLLCACPRAQLGRPAWLVTEQDAEFPRERFCLAASGAEDPARAEVLAGQLLRRKLERMLRAADDDERPECSRELAQRTVWFLGSLEPATLRSWSRSDGNLHAVLVGLEVSQIQDQLQQAKERLEREAKEQLEETDRVLNSGRPIAGAKCALEACQKLLVIESLERAVAHLQERQPVREDPPAVLERVRRELDGLQLRVVRGDAQRRRPDGRLEAPVLLGVYRRAAEGKLPAEGVPLLVEPPPSAPPVSCVTSELGLCQIGLENLPDVPAAQARVSIELDLTGIAEQRAADSCVRRMCLRWLGSKGPKADFYYLSAPAAAGRGMVLLEPGAGMRSALLEMFRRRIEAAISERGLSLVPQQAAADELAMTESLDEAPEAVRRVADYVVTGGLPAFVLRRVADGFFFCQARARLKITKTADGSVELDLDRQRQAAGRDGDGACRRALDALARECAAEAGKALAARGENP